MIHDPMSNLIAQLKNRSINHKMMAITKTTTKTIQVVCKVSILVGHVMRLSSTRESANNTINALPCDVKNNKVKANTTEPVIAATLTQILDAGAQ